MKDWFKKLLEPRALIALGSLAIAAFVAFSGVIKRPPKKVQEINADNNCIVDGVTITSDSDNSSELRVNCDGSEVKNSEFNEKSK